MISMLMFISNQFIKLLLSQSVAGAHEDQMSIKLCKLNFIQTQLIKNLLHLLPLKYLILIVLSLVIQSKCSTKSINLMLMILK